MKLNDMIIKQLEEREDTGMYNPATAATQGVAKALGRNAQQLQKGVTDVAKRTDVASQSSSDLNSTVMAMLQDPKMGPMLLRQIKTFKAQQDKMASATPGGDLDEPTAFRQGKTRQDMGIESVQEAKDTHCSDKCCGKEVTRADCKCAPTCEHCNCNSVNESLTEQQLINEFTSVGQISPQLINMLMGGDQELAQKAKMALNMIEKGRGINKTFIPAIKKLLSHLTDILADAGMAGYKVIDNLHKSMSPEKHAIATDSEEPVIHTGDDTTAGIGGQANQPEPTAEPTEAEILQYGVDNQISTVTDEQKQYVKDLIMKSKQQEEPEQKLAASKSYESQRDELRKLAGLSEAMSDVYGTDSSHQSEDKETVTYSKTKKDGDSTVTISANADSMEELHNVLKLAGITLPKSNDEPEHSEEPEVAQDVEIVAMPTEVEPESPCGTSDSDASYSTDKEVLVNYLKDKLKKRLS
jgi:hypothetical protein|tara:strand:+ start:1101 stop:2504 length:1404 start_codon:yes stop_codon:yes gene_type:complete